MRTRNPNAIVNLAPCFGSLNPYIIRALAKVLPYPVLAIFTPKKPCCSALSCNDFAKSKALFCHWKRESAVCFVNVLCFPIAGSAIFNLGNNRAKRTPALHTPNKCSSNACFGCLFLSVLASSFCLNKGSPKLGSDGIAE